MPRQLRWLVAACLLLSSGCRGPSSGEESISPATRAQLLTIKEGYWIYCTINGKPPKSIDELAPCLVATTFPESQRQKEEECLRMIRQGKYILVWNQQGVAQAKSGSVILIAYEQRTPDTGGFAVFADGRTQWMSPADLEQAIRVEEKVTEARWPEPAGDSDAKAVTEPGLNLKPSAWDSKLDVPEDACDESLNKHELVGTWEIISAEIAGSDATTTGYYEFKGNKFLLVEGDSVQERTFEIDPRSEPKRIDSRLTFPEGTVVIRGIYRIDGDVLIISDATPFRPRPSRFVGKTTKENDYSLCKLRRVASKGK